MSIGLIEHQKLLRKARHANPLDVLGLKCEIDRKWKTPKVCKCNLCTFFVHILKMRIIIMQVSSMQENSQTKDDSNVI